MGLPKELPPLICEAFALVEQAEWSIGDHPDPWSIEQLLVYGNQTPSTSPLIT